MKIKIFFLILIGCLISTFISIKTYAATWEFRWTNTVIKIPLGGNLSEYSLLPEAKLYRDGVLLTDANISYLRQGDFLCFLSNVNTTRVGTYKVWYKASENDKYCPGTCTGYRELISFIVEDSIAPKIDVINDNLFIQRVNIISPDNYDALNNLVNNNINVSDNYSECEIKINHNIDFTKKGTYPVSVSAIDSSGNRTTKSFNVTIYDASYPVIDYKGDLPLLLPMDGSISIKDLFSAYDEIDGDISNRIQYQKLDLSKIADYDYTVSVKNNSGNETTLTIQISVVDDVAPTITLTTKTLIVDYKTDFENYDFASKARISDNLPINYDNLIITTNVENKVGTYSVWYEYSDGVYDTKEELTVKCVSKEKPKIYTDDIIIDTKANIKLKDYITIVDESDSLVYESVEIDDSNVNYEKEGTYYANVYAINSSGLSSTERIKIIINDEKKLLDGVNVPILIVMIILLVITIGYGIFFIYYFLIRKRKTERNNNTGSTIK